MLDKEKLRFPSSPARINFKVFVMKVLSDKDGTFCFSFSVSTHRHLVIF